MKSGDYLIGIAGKLGVSLTALLDANDLTVESLILPGQTLEIPAGGSAPSESAATPSSDGGQTYTVVAGDFLYGIANRMDVKPAQLLAANSLEITSLILPGDELIVPDGGVVPAESPAPAAATMSASSADSSTEGGQAAVASDVDRVVAYARAQIGKDYEFFTDGPDSFDCSGLVKAAFREVGIDLPHYSGLQATFGTSVDWTAESIRAGDLVFAAQSGSDPSVISHVGIAVSATHWVQAAGTASGVKLSWMPSDSRILAVQRLL